LDIILITFLAKINYFYTAAKGLIGKNAEPSPESDLTLDVEKCDKQSDKNTAFGNQILDISDGKMKDDAKRTKVSISLQQIEPLLNSFPWILTKYYFSCTSFLFFIFNAIGGEGENQQQ
jgi:hypothetical protein